MATERTLSIIKPDATRRNLTGKINQKFEDAGLSHHRDPPPAAHPGPGRGFLRRAAQRPFFNDLVSFMISGPVVAQVLAGENAVLKNRDIMGATDPKKADRRHHPRGIR